MGSAVGNGRRALAEEVPVGYKRTEVGVIPEDWCVACLDRFWSVTDCKHVTAKFVASGYPVASIKEVRCRFVDLTNAKQTTQQFYNLLSEGGRKPEIGDLILSRNATVGEVAQVADWHPPFAMGQDVCLLRRKSHEFSPDFLQAIFHSAIIGNQLSDLMVGSTFKRANVQQIKSFVVPMPGPAEQRAIAEALSDVDGLLAALEALIAKKRAIKQATMQQLLTGRTRLPGFSGEWETKRLGDLLYYERPDRYIVQCTEYNDYGNLPVLTANKSFVLGYTDEDFGICRDIPVIVFDDFTTDCKYATSPFKVKSSAIKLLRTRQNRADLRYVFERMQLIRFPLGDHKRYYISDYQNIELPVPDFDEQQALSAVLSDMDAEIAVLERRRDKTRAVKQGMMQQLLTGRVRLVESALTQASASREID